MSSCAGGSSARVIGVGPLRTRPAAHREPPLPAARYSPCRWPARRGQSCPAWRRASCGTCRAATRQLRFSSWATAPPAAARRLSAGVKAIRHAGRASASLLLHAALDGYPAGALPLTLLLPVCFTLLLFFLPSCRHPVGAAYSRTVVTQRQAEHFTVMHNWWRVLCISTTTGGTVAICGQVQPGRDSMK